ncbi:MAG: IS1595 family transposase, partial [Actinobacteria bacterium]|nr:IS1595 family transposase [Actinomycetota bacterium]
MLHRLRSVLVRPGRERLTGRVEVDETFIGGEEPGLRGGRQRGKKTLVGVAVEVCEPKGFGRCRMAILPDASAASLHPFVTGHVAPGATVITDAWQGYTGIDELGYTRERHSQRAARQRGEDPFGLLPGVHRVASLEAMAARHPPGLGRRRASAGLPRQVRGSASTAEPPAAEGWCSTASSDSLSATNRCATGTSSSTPDPSGALQPDGLAGVTSPDRQGGPQARSPRRRSLELGMTGKIA